MKGDSEDEGRQSCEGIKREDTGGYDEVRQAHRSLGRMQLDSILLSLLPLPVAIVGTKQTDVFYL